MIKNVFTRLGGFWWVAFLAFFAYGLYMLATGHHAGG